MVDMLAQIENLWMQAETTTTVKHYHIVYDVVCEQLSKIRQVSYLLYTGDTSGNIIFQAGTTFQVPETAEECGICFNLIEDLCVLDYAKGHVKFSEDSPDGNAVPSRYHSNANSSSRYRKYSMIHVLPVS